MHICVEAVLGPKLRELDTMGFIQVIVYVFLGKNITIFGSRQFFDERIS